MKKSQWNPRQLFFPRSVAVIGASSRQLTIGNRIIQNLIDMRYRGKIIPINPRKTAICGLPAFPSITDVPDHLELDLAHIIVKNTLVPKILQDCAQRGVKTCIVNTAGFSETGPEGAALEAEMLDIARQTGIRIFGPNCQGIINTDPQTNAYCNFTFTKPQPGCISVYTQSGGIGEVINNRLCEIGEGLRMYASSGNACDIQCWEILDFWKNDPQTRVIILHLETVRDLLPLSEKLAELTRLKPVLGILGGCTFPGKNAVLCHTGGKIHDRNHEIQTLTQAGVLLINHIEEICRTAAGFSRLPVPTGNRVGILTNTGGAGIIAADELFRHGCRVENLDPEIIAQLQGVLLPEATLGNPIDLLATAGAEHFHTVLTALLNDEHVDSILINFITPFFVDCEAVATKLCALMVQAKKTIIPVIMTDKKIWADTLNIFQQHGFPIYSQPDMGARVLANMTRYGQQINHC